MNIHEQILKIAESIPEEELKKLDPINKEIWSISNDSSMDFQYSKT